METKKLNINGTFDRNRLIAKLLCLVSMYNRQHDLHMDIKLFKDWVENWAQENFEVDVKNFDKVVVNLQLFCLGNENNIFSKAIN